MTSLERERQIKLAIYVAETLVCVALMVWVSSPQVRMAVTSQARRLRSEVTAHQRRRIDRHRLGWEVFMVQGALDRYNATRDAEQLARALVDA